MKTSKHFLLFLIGFSSMSFNSMGNVEQNRSKEEVPFINQREVAIKAYVQIQDQWVEGFVFLMNGVVTKVQFPDEQVGGYVFTAGYFQSTRPSSLNPNNPMAVKNNFTHYVDITNYGRAYFSM